MLEPTLKSLGISISITSALAAVDFVRTAVTGQIGPEVIGERGLTKALEYGILAVIVWFFIWQSWRREEATRQDSKEKEKASLEREEKDRKERNDREGRMANRINQLEEQMFKTVASNREIMEDFSKMMRKLTEKMPDLNPKRDNSNAT